MTLKVTLTPPIDVERVSASMKLASFVETKTAQSGLGTFLV